MESVSDGRAVLACQVPEIDQRDVPDEDSDRRVDQEALHIHSNNSRGKRNQRPEQRHKPREKNNTPPMRSEPFLRHHQTLLAKPDNTAIPQNRWPSKIV